MPKRPRKPKAETKGIDFAKQLDAAIEPSPTSQHALPNQQGQPDLFNEHILRLANLGELLALVTHEIANVLSPVGTYAQLAMRHPEDHALSTKALSKAALAVDRVSRITDAVLSLSRHDAYKSGVGGLILDETSDVPRGTLRDQANGCDVAYCLDQALECIGRDLARDGIILVRQIEPNLRVPAGAIALEHVLLNLILNARNSLIRVGGGTIAVRAKIDLSATKLGSAVEGFIIIEVEDDGLGFDAKAETSHRSLAIQSNTLSTTVRTHSNTNNTQTNNLAESESARNCTQGHRGTEHSYDTRQYPRQGSGWGLVVIQRLASAMGAQIEIWSKPGEGARCTLRIPRASSKLAA